MNWDQAAKLKSFINDMPNELIGGEYAHEIDGKMCFCVIGGMAKHLGHDDTFVYNLTDPVWEWEESYDQFSNEAEFLEELQENYGLTAVELNSLQSFNDKNYKNEKERASFVRNYLWNLIREKEEEQTAKKSK